MVRFGLDVAFEQCPSDLNNATVGVLCHAASITSERKHILSELAARIGCRVGAVFGPQHGLCGQTQDNMVEWEGGYRHPQLDVPVYSLYGAHRKPTPAMLEGLDGLVVDLQDVGARPYTYIWTLKLCLQACREAGMTVWVLDRPNPIGAVAFDGPLLEPEYFSFVGGACIPLCHRMTVAEIARLLKQEYVRDVDLRCLPMSGWWRDSIWPQTGLPWVLPSPNMPTFDTAVVYPGMVLLEATNLSEGRGTTRPFELFGAPYLDRHAFEAALDRESLRGASLRPHDFIPTFNKHAGQACTGWQLHVDDIRAFRPVRAAVALIAAAAATSESFAFSPPPYEYETEKMPFDILIGNDRVREEIMRGGDIGALAEGWHASDARAASLEQVSLYQDYRS